MMSETLTRLRELSALVEKAFGKDTGIAAAAVQEIEQLQAEVERLRETIATQRRLEAQNQGEINELEARAITAEQERDQMKIELERYSMSAGAADQFRREALAMRQALGFDKYGDDIAPVDLLDALDRRDAEVIERFRSQLRDALFPHGRTRGCYSIGDFDYVWCQARQQAQEVQS